MPGKYHLMHPVQPIVMVVTDCRGIIWRSGACCRLPAFRQAWTARKKSGLTSVATINASGYRPCSGITWRDQMAYMLRCGFADAITRMQPAGLWLPQVKKKRASFLSPPRPHTHYDQILRGAAADERASFCKDAFVIGPMNPVVSAADRRARDAAGSCPSTTAQASALYRRCCDSG